jgi:hypothetical protein
MTEQNLPSKAPDDAEQRELVPVAGNYGLLPTHELGPDTLRKAEEQRQILDGLKLIALRSLNATDITKIGGKPFLNESGCMKFAQIYGVSFRDLRVDPVHYSDERGPVIEFYATVTAMFQNRLDIDTGSASTAEVFFNGKEPDGKTRRLPLSEIKIPDVRKKSVTNAKARVIKKLLGLSFTWDELRDAWQAAGKNVDDIAKVTYGERQEKSKSTGRGILSEIKRKLANMIYEMAGEDKELAANMLESYTSFQGRDGKTVKGKRTAKELSDKHAEVTLKKVQEDYEKFLAEGLANANGGKNGDEEVPS